LSPQAKQPIYIRRRDDQPFALAGLWDHWEAPDASSIDSCTIITTQPNELLADIHDRMPVILPTDSYDVWLDPDCRDAEALNRLLAPCDAEQLVVNPVSTLVNNPRNDSAQCIASVLVPLPES
jgi:putative SOS response-associated peptidase YedK